MARTKKKKTDKLYTNSKPKDTSKDDGILDIARERAISGAAYWKNNWDKGEDDLKFLAGEQWDESVRTERENDGRPCLTNNVLPTFVDQLIGDQRQNRPSIKVSATDATKTVENEDGKSESLKISNEAGSKDYELAEVYTGLIKSIEYNTDAETSYDVAFESAVSSGLGYMRVRSDYINQEGFEQDLIIDHIENQFSVIIDPSAKEYDKSDMNWGFIDDVMERDIFKEKYPNIPTQPIDAKETSGSWYGEKTVKISEYFTREEVIKTMALMSDGSKYLMEELEDVADELYEQGTRIVQTRKVKTYKVVWRKITGLNVLEGPIELPCSTIPIIPVYGKSISIKQRKEYLSLIRNAKNAQQMANYWDTAATEMVALAPKAPYKGTPEQVEGFEEEWQDANTSNNALLLYNPQFQGDRGPTREQPALVPSAEITLGMQSADKIKSTIGMYDASLGNAGNETSGKAIMARQRQGDRGTFAFVDNLSKSIRRVGKLLIEMIPVIYDTERVVRIKFPDDTEDFVTLNKQIFDDESEKWVTIHDLNVQKYDVVVSTGPSYSTQRIEAADTMMQFIQAVPTLAPVMVDLIAKNQDWVGADVIAERLKKMVDPNLLTAKEREELKEEQEKENEGQEQQGPTMEEQLAMKQVEIQQMEVEAKTLEAEADIAQAQADMLKAQLETEDSKEKLAMINDLANGGNQMAQTVRELVAQAIAEIKQAQV